MYASKQNKLLLDLFYKRFITNIFISEESGALITLSGGVFTLV